MFEVKVCFCDFELYFPEKLKGKHLLQHCVSLMFLISFIYAGFDAAFALARATIKDERNICSFEYFCAKLLVRKVLFINCRHCKVRFREITRCSKYREKQERIIRRNSLAKIS